MRRLPTLAVLVLCGALAWAFVVAKPASASITPYVSFQGKLTNPDGTNVTDGTYGVRFRIYTDPTADSASTCYPTVTTNTCRWEETQGSVSVSGGLFQVNLGSSTTLPGSGFNFNTGGLYLGVKVGSDAEMTPRIQFTAAPYAFNADMLDGLDSSGYVQLSPGSQQSGNINIGGTVTSGAVNGLTLTQAADGFTVAGGTTSRTLTVQGANITIGSTIQPTSAGALSIKSNGANTLSLDTGGAAAIDIGVTGTSVNAIAFGNATSNPSITFNGSGTFGTPTGAISLNGNTTLASGKSLTLTSGAISGVTTLATSSTINSNTFSSSTLTFGAAGTATVQAAASQALTITANAASTWSTSAGTLTLQSGSGTVSLGSSTVFSSSGALSIASGAATTLTVDSGTTGALNLGTTSSAKTITIGNTTGNTNIAHLVGANTNAFSVQGAASAVYMQFDTSNNRLYVGNPTADATAFLLILDSKNTTGDPTGINGAEYYNSANNKFRCDQNSIWMDCSSGFNTNTVTADQAATQSSTTMQNVTALGFTANANTTYVFTAWIPLDDSNATADSKYTFTVPAGATLNAMTQYSGTTAAANVICNITASATACANTTVNIANHFITVSGQATIGGTAGTVQFQFAQNTSTAVSFPVVKKGATISWHQSN